MYNIRADTARHIRENLEIGNVIVYLERVPSMHYVTKVSVLNSHVVSFYNHAHMR